MSYLLLSCCLSVYVLRRSSAKGKSPETVPQEIRSERTDPNPERLKELIEDVEKNTAVHTEANVSAAIDNKFPPAEASQVKSDFKAISLLVNPPGLSNYDFYTLINQYVRGLSAIATKAELFRLRGYKSNGGPRVLPLIETAAALAPPTAARTAVYTSGSIVSVAVSEVRAVLTDEQEELPLIVAVKAEFKHFSAGGLYSGQRSEYGSAVYRLVQGQENNWLKFELVDKSLYGFQDFSYRLSAADVKALLAALKKDIGTYLQDISDERPLVAELADELKELLRMVSRS